MTLFIFLVTLGYLMGSVCSAVIVCRLFSLPDPRIAGSKNPGATNVLRLAGKQYAAIVMIADLLKGTIPVLIAKSMGAEPATIAFTALAAVIGHMYPVFFGFQGGKGVATAIGALLGLQFIVGVMVSATWLIVAKFSRYSSLASIIAITLAPFYILLLLGRQDVLTPLFIMAILIIFKHKNNISRLVEGIEPQIQLKPNIIEDVMKPTHPPLMVEREDFKFQEEQQKPIPQKRKAAKTIKSAESTTPKTSETAKPKKKKQATKKTTATKPKSSE